MKSSLQFEEAYLLNILKLSLTGCQDGLYEGKEISGEQWELIINLAERHSVLSVLYDVLQTMEGIPKHLYDRVQMVSLRTVLQNYKLLYITNNVVRLLEKENIRVVVLKGVGTSALYLVPEYRKSGDVDLLLGNMNDIDRASDLLKANNYFMCEKQNTIYHVEFVSKEGIYIELHTQLTEPFDSHQVNEYLEELAGEYADQIEYAEILGSVLPIPKDAYHAYFLLLHMLHHFLRAGFGIRLLCDWVVFWKRDIAETEKESYLRMLRRSGLTGFSDSITAICIRYLGLEELTPPLVSPETFSLEQIDELIKDILEAGEFGQDSGDRMVAIRGGSMIAYIREFQHQMHLNYPKAGKIFILWPVLWINTLARFLNNNRRIRQVTVRAVIQKAKKRGRNLKDMKLFKAEE